MQTTTTRTVCIVGANAQVSSRIAQLLDGQRGRFGARWKIGEHADADLLLVDAESVHGHMDWLRARASGRLVAACSAQPEAYENDLCLRKPILAGNLVSLLNRVGAELDKAPKAKAKVTIPSAPAEITTSEPVRTVAAQAQATLLDLLGAPATAGGLRLAAEGLPTLLLDPASRTWSADAGLKVLAAWSTRQLKAGDLSRPTAAEFEAERAALPAAEPFQRLQWLAHLMRGNGRLVDVDESARFKLARWPKSEREFPKHFRIATVMLKQSATLEEIAAQSNATSADVADFINAYHAIGYVEVEGPAASQEPARAGRFARALRANAN